jgi:hypothetical protein
MNPLTMSDTALADLLRKLRRPAPATAPFTQAPSSLAEVIAQKSLGGLTQGVTGADRLPGPVFLRLRQDGLALWRDWSEEATLEGALMTALARPEANEADVLEVCLTHDYRPVPRERFDKVFTSAQCGILGIEFAFQAHRLRRAPSETIATNRRFPRELELFLSRLGINENTFYRLGGVVRAFSARQLLFHLGPPEACTTLHRGGRVVEAETLGPQTITELIDGMAQWMLANLNDDGHLTYKYWPSRGEESTADNPIRRFMATIALLRAGRVLKRDDLVRAADRNLRFNLARFYREVDGLGAIEWDGEIKLGSVALAALAILEHPAQRRFRRQLAKLSACVEALWQSDGSFRTFLRPSERAGDNQNFYPGEALLFWAHLYQEKPEPALLERCLASFRYYRAWHRKKPNPAFVPWHSQAYCLLYAETGEVALRDFVFEMNDWLLPIQQWGPPLAPDLWGRFYDPRHPEYGPPHASSTGVYIEGLADALQLARQAGQADRAKSYERVIWRAIRSLRQLQYRDEIDAFYVSKRPKVMGGLRSEAYHNEIRVDNVQHGLMGLLKLRGMSGFSPDSAVAPDGRSPLSV